MTEIHILEDQLQHKHDINDPDPVHQTQGLSVEEAEAVRDEVKIHLGPEVHVVYYGLSPSGTYMYNVYHYNIWSHTRSLLAYVDIKCSQAPTIDHLFDCVMTAAFKALVDTRNTDCIRYDEGASHEPKPKQIS